MSKVDPKLYKHHLYTSAPDVAEITMPLKQYFGIDYFLYECDYVDLKTFKIKRSAITNSQYLLISSHLYYKKLKNIEYDFYKNLPKKYYFLDVCMPEWAAGMARDFSICNMVSKVTRSNANSVEKVFFGTSSSDPSYKNFYLQNQDLLDKFIAYFMDKAHKVVEASHQNNFELKNVKVNVYENLSSIGSIQNFSKIDQILAPKHYVIRLPNSKNIRVPAAEMHCLQLLGQGRSAKEIGNVLGISSRTVEANWQRSKMRLGCYTRKELLDILEKNK